jgi:isoamylase
MWVRPDGEEMADDEWGQGWARSLGVVLNGGTLGEVDETGELVRDSSFLMMLNCHHEPIQFYMPTASNVSKWEVLVDTHEPDLAAGKRFKTPGEAIELVPLSFVLAREVQTERPRDPTNPAAP